MPHRHPGRLHVRHVAEHDAADRQGPEIRDRVRLPVVRHPRRALRLERPADERGEAAGPRLHLAHAEQMLDPVGETLAQAVHHRHRRLHALAVRLFLDAQPLVGLRLLAGDPLAHLVHQNLPAPTRDAVEPRLTELADDLRHRQAEPLGKEHDLGRREPVDVDRMVALDVAHEIQIPLERDVGVVPPLHEDLDAAERLALVDLATDLLEAQHVALEVLGPAVKRTELAVRDADVGVVDVAIDDVGDDRLGMEPPPFGVGE